MDAPSYPYRPQVRLSPEWSSRRARIIATCCVICAIAATLARGSPSLSMIDDLALRVGLPVMLAFVLAFAPRPATSVGAIAVDLTIAGLLVATFAGDAVLLLLIGYPLVLASAVAIGRGRTDDCRATQPTGERP